MVVTGDVGARGGISDDAAAAALMGHGGRWVFRLAGDYGHGCID